MKYRVIHETAKECKQYSIKKMCRKLDVSRSGYYKSLSRVPSSRKQNELKLKEQIRKLFEKSKKRYGSPRIHAELRAQGIRCGKKLVERLMREMGLQARPRRRYKVTTNSKHGFPVAPNLLNRQFKVTAPNQVWVADISVPQQAA